MNTFSLLPLFLSAGALSLSPFFDQAFAGHSPRAVLPDAVVDLRTIAGVARVNAHWRYSDTRINEIAHRSVGPDLKASGPKNRTYDFTPDARTADFDDSKWEAPALHVAKHKRSTRHAQ